MLTESEKNWVALGYSWEPDWSYEQFIGRNPELPYNMSYDIYLRIEQNYVEFVYEENKR